MNKTFTGFNKNGIWKHNACVGWNGNPGIMTYSEGYNEAVKILLDAALENKAPIDLLVYPIVYSARHSIELFLKDQLEKIFYINKMLDSACKDKVDRIHNLSLLWDKFKKSAIKENRYEKLVDKIDEYIVDFVQCDDSGENFRYPYSREGQKCLNEISCINLYVFKNRYEELERLLLELEDLSLYLYEEYSQNSTVAGFSRNVIKKIAIELPDRDLWSNPSSDPTISEVKKNIIKKYNIGSNKKLDKIIEYIESHAEFSLLINKEIPIEELSVLELKRFVEIYDQYLSDNQSVSFFDFENKYVKMVSDNLPHKAIAALAHLFDMGYFDLYSEEYLRGLPQKLEEEDYFLITDYLFRGRRTIERIKYGLIKTGQKTLLEVINLREDKNTDNL